MGENQTPRWCPTSVHFKTEKRKFLNRNIRTFPVPRRDLHNSPAGSGRFSQGLVVTSHLIQGNLMHMHSISIETKKKQTKKKQATMQNGETASTTNWCKQCRQAYQLTTKNRKKKNWWDENVSLKSKDGTKFELLTWMTFRTCRTVVRLIYLQPGKHADTA